jgi:hypothetical protein
VNYWLASLFVPGWAQLIAARYSACGWFALALLGWCTVGANLLARDWLMAFAAFCAVLLVHLLSALNARRLFGHV